MHEVVAFSEIGQAQNEFDNGGHFYNFFTKAGDHEITKAELEVAGKTWCSQEIAIYYHMATHNLSDSDHSLLESEFTDKLNELLEHYPVTHPTPTEFTSSAKEGASCIVEGVAQFQESREVFTGMLMVPMMTGNIVSMTPMPIHEYFKVLEITGEGDQTCTVIVGKHEELPLGKTVRWGGIAKQSLDADGSPLEGQVCLSARYFTILG